MKKIVILIIIISCVFLPSMGTAQTKDNPVPPQPGPEERIPSDCGEYCATYSKDGYSIHFWYESGTKPADEIFDYAGISYERRDENGNGTYIYRGRGDDRGKVYIVVSPITMLVNKIPLDQTAVREHYIVGADVAWDNNKNPGLDALTPGKNFPNKGQNKNQMPKGVDENNQRYSYRVVISGTVYFKNEVAGNNQPVNNAQVQIRINSDNGPRMGAVRTDSKGYFEFSREGKNEEIWLNKNKIDKIYLYAHFEEGGIKYETKVNQYEFSFPGDFRPHQKSEYKDNTLVLDDGVKIELDGSNKVDDFRYPDDDSKGIIQEVTGGKNPWQIDVLKQVACWIRNAIIHIYYFLANFAAFFLQRNY